MQAAVYIPMAKLLDVWGRAEGFALMVGCATFGLILMAASQNLPMYCAAEVFSAVGFGGINYTLCVLAADVTNLKNRGLAFAFTSSPYMITAFAGSKSAEAFILNVSWRWGFGAFAIILPVVASPIYFLLTVSLRKAQTHGIIVKEKNNQSVLQRVKDVLVAFDSEFVSRRSLWG